MTFISSSTGSNIVPPNQGTQQGGPSGSGSTERTNERDDRQSAGGWSGFAPKGVPINFNSDFDEAAYIQSNAQTLERFYQTFSEKPKEAPHRIATKLLELHKHTRKILDTAKHYYRSAKQEAGNNATTQDITEKALAAIRSEVDKRIGHIDTTDETPEQNKNRTFAENMFQRMNPNHALDNRSNYPKLKEKPTHFGLYTPLHNKAANANDGPVHGPSCAKETEGNENVLMHFRSASVTLKEEITTLLGAGRVFSCEEQSGMLSKAVDTDNDSQGLGTRSMIPGVFGSAYFEGPEATIETMLAMAFANGFSEQETMALRALVDPEVELDKNSLIEIYHKLPELDEAFQKKISSKIGGREGVDILNKLAMAPKSTEQGAYV